MPPAGCDGPMHGRMMGRMHAAMDPAKVDARLDKLKSALKLSNGQQAGWQRYADFMREQAKQHREQFDKMREQTPPAHAPADSNPALTPTTTSRRRNEVRNIISSPSLSLR